jgi:double zinc ribbon protein
MHCTGCETDNRDGRKFSAQCGQPLKLVCASCVTANGRRERFCGECGAGFVGHAQPGSEQSPKMLTASEIRVTSEQQYGSSAIEDERKTFTVLFAAIKGSTELMEDLDREEARAIVDPAIKLMIYAIQGYNGHVVQSTGDDIFALFGPLSPTRIIHNVRSMRRCGCRTRTAHIP